MLSRGLSQGLSDLADFSGTPLLGGVPFARFLATGWVVPRANHPVCAFQWWLRGIFLDSAATDPNLGGELPRRLSETLEFAVPEAGHEMVVYHSRRLHVRVAD